MPPKPAEHMDVRVLEEQALIALVQASARAATASDAVVRSRGLSPSQYNVLRILHVAGEEGLTRSEISERMVTRDPDMTRLLKGLESMGLVGTWRSEVDGRQRISAVTPSGAALLLELNPQVTRAAQRSLGHLSEQRLKDLIELLTELSSGASDA
ncbi:MAG: MarR family transcriptional regulator [Longimicrobiales bacterium]